MSLIVAVTTSTGVRIISDSRVTPSEVGRGLPRRPNFVNGALKAVMLHPALCVCYAGDAEYAQEAVRELGVNPFVGFDLEAVFRLLTDKSERSADFLVASLKGGPSIARMRNGVLETALSRAHIGDDDAFGAYQDARYQQQRHLPAISSGDYGEAALMFMAMKQVIDDDSVDSVGELAIAVVPQRDGFHYATMGWLQGGPMGGQSIPNATWTTAQFGGTADGGLAYSVMTPDKPGVGAVAAHFRQGSLGVLFHPTRLRDPDVIRGVSYEGFRAAIERRHGLVLNGVGIS